MTVTTATNPQTTTTTTTAPAPAADDSKVIGSLATRASYEPLSRNKSLDAYAHHSVTPAIGEEFPDLQLSSIVSSPDADKLIADLAVLISERGVAFFRAQDLNLEDQKTLGRKLGELSGKPSHSGLHIHPVTEPNAKKGDEISVISSETFDPYAEADRSLFSSQGWHSDITFEPVPSDYAILKVHTSPDVGGDTLWASAYEAYSRLSPAFRSFLEDKKAVHEAKFFERAAQRRGHSVRDQIRGHPANNGAELSAVHPVIRVNPVTGWKGIYVNPAFTRRILGVTRDESDLLLNHLYGLVSRNHDLQVRFNWTTYDADSGLGDIAIWDNRSTFHAATQDYEKTLRVGDRVVSLGEKPYFSPEGKERREALGLPPAHAARNLGQVALQQHGVKYE